MAKKTKLTEKLDTAQEPAPAKSGGGAVPSLSCGGQEPVLTPDAEKMIEEIRALRAKVEAQEKKSEKKQEKAAEAEEEAEITKEQLLGLEIKAGETTGYNCNCGAPIVKNQHKCENCGGELDWMGIE